MFIRFGSVVPLLFMAMTQSHASTIYVSPHGNDDQPGTSSKPLRTISSAAQRAMPGDVVFVLEGVYRERVAPARGGEPGKPIVYRAEPGKRVVVKGSEVWHPNWTDEGDGIFSATPTGKLFNDRSPEYPDHYNPLKVQLSSTPWRRNGRREAERRRAGDDRIGRCDDRIVYTCGQVFVNGKQFKEVPLSDELEPETWWYDPQTERLKVNFGKADPNKQIVELTTRRRLFAPTRRGLGYIVVEGFIFEHCGNQYPTNFWSEKANAQKGAVGTEAGHNWVIRRNVIRYAKTFAIDVGRVDGGHSNDDSAYDNLVEENYVLDNGSAGILSCGSRNLKIRKNVILRNNQLRFIGVKRWEQAGIKCHFFAKGLIQGNYIADNFDTYGIWLDNQFPDSRVTRNVIRDNGRAGIFLEMSDYGFDRLLVENNIIVGNHENAVYIHDASGATFANNLLANTADSPGYGQAVYIRQVTSRTRTYYHSFYDNLLIGNARNIDVNYPAARSGPQRFDGNLFSVTPDARAFTISDESDSPSPWSQTEFRSRVLTDLEMDKSLSGMMDREGRVTLTSREWRLFWRRHEIINGRNSAFDPQSQVRYDPDTHLLAVDLSLKPTFASTTNHSTVRRDFFGDTRDTDGVRVRGPFQQLKRGRNHFDIWDGLPILRQGHLPPPNWTNAVATADGSSTQLSP